MVNRKPIVVVGSINMDLVARTPRIPMAGETITGTGFETTPGGKGANQAVAVARLGYPVTIIGLVGEDVFGGALLGNLASAGVDVAPVARVSGPSGIAQILVADRGENSIVVVPGANGRVEPEYIYQRERIIRSAGMVLCQLELPMPTVSHTLELCAKSGVPVMLDPAPAATLPDSAWPRIAWFTPNEHEAAFYAGGDLSVEDAARHLLARGLNAVAFKRGRDGCYIATADNKVNRVPAFAVDAIDTVGAGDCFNGAFAVAILEGQDPPVAARFAAAAAAISVTRRGAQASMPSRSEVESFLQRRSQASGGKGAARIGANS
jgi:ribokinase